VSSIYLDEYGLHFGVDNLVRLVILSIPLLVFPRFLLFVASPPNTLARDTLTPLESFLSLQLGIGLLVVGVSALFFHLPLVF